jgi:hypothetical protein
LVAPSKAEYPEGMKVELSEASVYQRIRRRLQGSDRSLRIARESQRPELGKYFLVEVKSVTPKVDLEALARELACMEPWETLEKS